MTGEEREEGDRERRWQRIGFICVDKSGVNVAEKRSAGEQFLHKKETQHEIQEVT